MKIGITEREEITKLKAAKTAEENLKGKGNPTNKDVVDLMGQVLNLMRDIHKAVVK